MFMYPFGIFGVEREVDMSLTKFLAPDGTTVNVVTAANALPVVNVGGGSGGDATLAEQQAQTLVLEDIRTAATDANPVLVDIGQDNYETVAASQTSQICGGVGSTGDYLAGLLVVPATTSPGGVSIGDGSTSIVVFTGGASSVSNLVPFFVPLGIKSTASGWTVTTGANVSAVAVGQFT